ncbi:hypothetical protein V6N13_101454 [Hibiscus sabdariffa]|uniref:Uncharacterized protein n=1 Tax=Hibiscus sabdariffa TaxID=183260 RepID=A0ABR2QLX7_9ROSI
MRGQNRQALQDKAAWRWRGQGHLACLQPSPASTLERAWWQALIEGSACYRTRPPRGGVVGPRLRTLIWTRPPGGGVVGPLHAWQPQATQVGRWRCGPSRFGGEGHLKVARWSPQQGISSTAARLESLCPPTRPPQGGEVLPLL